MFCNFTLKVQKLIDETYRVEQRRIQVGRGERTGRGGGGEGIKGSLLSDKKPSSFY